LKVDAERNGIQYRDESGRYADFHALRYTWATFLLDKDLKSASSLPPVGHYYRYAFLDMTVIMHRWGLCSVAD